MGSEKLPQIRFSRRGVLKGGAALAGVAALDSLPYHFEILKGPKIFKAEYVNAQIVGVEKDILDVKGSVIGKFYSHGGDGKELGYSITNSIYKAFVRLGGIDVLGYPISHQFEKAGFRYQLFQAGALQYNPQEGSSDGWVLANSFDILAEMEAKNPQLRAEFQSRGIPEHNTAQLPVDKLLERLNASLQLLDRYQTLGDRKLSLNEAVNLYGAPTSEVTDFGLYLAIRCQRIGFQLWLQSLPNLPTAGSITSFLAGQLLKEFGWVDNPKDLEPLPFQTGGGIPEIPQFNLQEVQSGKGKQTEWVVQKEVNTPIQIQITKPQQLTELTDKYLTNHKVKQLKIIWLPVGIKEINGERMTIVGANVTLHESDQPLIARTYASIQKDENAISVYFSLFAEEEIAKITKTIQRSNNYNSVMALVIADNALNVGSMVYPPGYDHPADIDDFTDRRTAQKNPGININFT